ncbi:hypothetical protein, conserved [Leishmania tarentolae]|uniref:Uncharacterized protein n=1 Tax=Leishmania tarentolae TaxID=5689 RepID=A0A640KCI5_LEITA|nr:hypothetical protein, conserved [Leishmania tarentolae]
MDRQHCPPPSASAGSPDGSMPPQQPGGQQPSFASCLPPARRSTTRRLCALAAGVVVFHVLTSAVQERIFHLPGFTNLLLLSCGETFCTTVLAGLLLVWDGLHQPSGRAASEHQGPDTRPVATTVTVGTAEATPQEPRFDAVYGMGAITNKQRLSFGGAVAYSPDAVCEAEHLPEGQQNSRAHGDRRDAPTSVTDAVLPVAVAATADAVDGGKESLLTADSVHDSPSTSGAAGLSSICRVLCPSTVATLWYVRIAVLMSCSLYLTNRTSFFLSYSLQVIFKSSKLLCMIVVHRWWMRYSHEAAAPASANNTGSDDDTGSTVHQWCAVAASTRRDGVSGEGGVPEPFVDDKVPDTGERHLCGETQERGRACASPPPSTSFSTVAVDVPLPARHGCASSQSLATDPQRSWWSLLRCSGPRRRLGQWPRFWRRHGTDDMSRWCPTREWLRACAVPLSLVQRCTLRRAKLPIEKEGRAEAATGLRQPISRTGVSERNQSSDSDCPALEMPRVLGAWRVWQLRRLFRDTEVMACIIIVAGLVSFTYAVERDGHVSAVTSGPEEDAAAMAKVASAEVAAERHLRTTRLRGHASGFLTGEYAVTVDAAAAANPSHSASIGAGLAQAGASLPLSSPFTSLPLPLQQSITADVCRLSARWLMTLVGVAGVLMSNMLDCIIYTIEEAYCFHATVRPSRGSSRGTRKHEGAAREKAHPLGDVQRGAVPLQHHPHHRQRSTSPCPPTLSSHRESPVPASSRQHTVLAPLATASPAQIAASPQELLFMVNGIATLLYVGGLGASWLLDRFLDATAPLAMPEAEGGAVSALTAAEARQRAACKRLLVTAQLTGNGTLPVDCGAWVTRQPPLQRLASRSTAPPWEPLSEALPPSSTEGHSLSFFFLLIALESVTSLTGTLCLLRIVDEFNGVMAVVVTSVRKALTIWLSFALYGRRFTLLHAAGMAGVMGGALWYELQRRRRCGV